MSTSEQAVRETLPATTKRLAIRLTWLGTPRYIAGTRSVYDAMPDYTGELCVARTWARPHHARRYLRENAHLASYQPEIILVECVRKDGEWWPREIIGRLATEETHA